MFGNINVLAIRVIAIAIIMASVRRKPESESPKYVMRDYVLNWLKIGWYINGTNILGKHAPKPNIVILLLLFHYIRRWFHTFITPCILYICELTRLRLHLLKAFFKFKTYFSVIKLKRINSIAKETKIISLRRFLSTIWIFEP